MSKHILANKPLVYSSAKELWNFYVKNKFTILKTTTSVNCYYDFIFAAGTVGYWLAHEKNEPIDNEYYQIFTSIYNNTKHYELNRKRFLVYVIDNQKSIMPTDGKGNTIFTDDMIFDNNALFLDKCEGESDFLKLCCKIHNDETGEEWFIMLYEICKRIYNLYDEIFS